MENWILWYIIKKVFQFFQLFWARLVYKYAKSANMTPKIFFPIIFNMAVKKRRIWCQFRIHWKVPLSRKFTQRKLEGWEILNTVLKDFTSFAGFWYPAKKHLYFISVSGAFLGISLPPTPNWSRFDLFIDVYSISFFYCIASYTLYFIYFYFYFTCHFFLWE
jgi:hypothetical protein